MDTLSAEEREFVNNIHRKTIARIKWKNDVRNAFKLLNESNLKATKMLMSQADYDDIVKWQSTP